ncbi:MAG: sensor histidine kinase [Cohaesibacteraceae bacterium]|nr:sensor histidine kinase [Cohaesibacteraceae bacterium]
MQVEAYQYSLRKRLLLWLLIPLSFIGLFALVDAYRSASATADEVSDRVLAGSVLAISERVFINDDGSLEVDIPYVALDMLRSAAQDKVFYRIEGPDGSFVTGYSKLIVPAELPAQQGDILFGDGFYRGEGIRVAVLSSAASSGSQSYAYRVVVAETTIGRSVLTQKILVRSALRQALLIVSAAIIIWFAVSRSLRPLYRLAEAIGRRSSEDLRPILHKVPEEVYGLVVTINAFMQRLQSALGALRQFTGNASHQIRTPLAILRTQQELVLRATSLDEAKEAARAADIAVVHAERVLTQLLMLARIDEAASKRRDHSSTDVAELAREICSHYLGDAENIDVDLGFEGPQSIAIYGDPLLLGELVRNLLDNAIRHAAGASIITVRIIVRESDIYLDVEDDGSGIPLSDRTRLLERFEQLSASYSGGAGLGLSIVEDIALLHGGGFALLDGTGGKGIIARVILPIAIKTSVNTVHGRSSSSK